jgi:hypothetical protein
MTAYKLKDKYNRLDAGRLFYRLGTEVLLIATPTLPQEFFYVYQFDTMKRDGLVEEVDLLKEKWIHPHLYKPIKEELLTHIKTNNHDEGSMPPNEVTGCKTP